MIHHLEEIDESQDPEQKRKDADQQRGPAEGGCLAARIGHNQAANRKADRREAQPSDEHTAKNGHDSDYRRIMIGAMESARFWRGATLSAAHSLLLRKPGKGYTRERLRPRAGAAA